MRQCPDCKRIYYDETLNFCLEDGAELVYGPANDEPATAVMSEPRPVRVSTGFPAGEAKTRELPTQLPTSPADPSLLKRNSVIAAIVGLSIVTVLGVGSYWFYGRASSKEINSIAVMPFVNESASADAEYLSDGMTEILIGSLSQLPNLNVKARSSVFRYKGKEIDPRHLATELGVQAILTGRIVQRANNLTLYVELVDTSTENVLWKGDYNRSMTDLVALQNEIAHDVSQKLRSKLSTTDQQKLAKKTDTTNAEAYRLYLQGRFFWNKRRIGDMGKAIGYFQQAIALDPNYALAYAGLADAVAQPSDVVPFAEREKLSREAALKALSLDDSLAEAHTALAHIQMRFELKFVESERELKRAMELDSKWADTYQRYSELCAFLGRHDEAVEWARRGLEIEPFNLPLNTGYGGVLMAARRYDEAIAQLNKTLEMEPNFRTAHVVLATTYGLKGMYAESVKHRVRALELASQDQLAINIQESFARGGWRGYLQAEYDRFAGVERSFDRTPYYNEAVILAMLGEKEKAFDTLNRSIEARENPSLVFLKVEPRFDPIRDDPRFNELLKRLGLPL